MILLETGLGFLRKGIRRRAELGSHDSDGKTVVVQPSNNGFQMASIGEADGGAIIVKGAGSDDIDFRLQISPEDELLSCYNSPRYLTGLSALIRGLFALATGK